MLRLKTKTLLQPTVLNHGFAGFGNSSDAKSPEDKGAFLVKLFQKLNADKPVLVSPSMSGQFSLPTVHGKSTLD